MFRKSLVTVSASALMLFCASQANAADLYEPAMPDLSAVMTLYGGGGIHNTFGWSCGSGSCSNGDRGDDDFSAKGHLLFGGEARVASESWQAEIIGSVIGDMDTGNAYEGSNFFALGGHWLSRSPESTMGVFGGFSSVGFQDSTSSAYHAFGGLEYASFNDNSTFFGQLGGIAAIGGATTDTWEAGIFGAGGWRYFFSEMSKVELDVMIGWGYFDNDSCCSTDNSSSITAAWGAEYEHQFGYPFSAFAAYRGHYVHDPDQSCCGGGDDDEIISHAFLVGIRIDVNRTTLLARDRTGAGTFKLPDIHRAVAWPDEL